MRLLIKMLAHLAVPIVIGAFALLFFLIYNYHNIFLPIFGVFVLILIIGGIISEFNILAINHKYSFYYNNLQINIKFLQITNNY